MKKLNMKNFEFLDHTGDIKFRAYGKNINEMFENCALAMSDAFSRSGKIKPLKKKEIKVTGKDYESLIYNFIDEIVYLFDAENFVVSKAKVKIKGFEMDVEIYGDDAFKYKDLDAIKAPTYAEMYVKQDGKMWECQVVLDV